MSAPLDFLRIFAGKLREAGIRFAITSGMACVHYGLQQTTKDSDWIIAPEDLGKLRELLMRLETAAPLWRVSYRQIFGAPLDAQFMAHGWTSHLLLTDPDGAEHKADLFGKAPRVQKVETEPGDADYASRHVVALMKRTDRDRDWPVVDGLGWQLQDRHRAEGILHIQDAAKLLAAWQQTDATQRSILAIHRPLLRCLDSESDPDRIDALVRAERIIWECVNQERYGLFTRAWKDFFRQWRLDQNWQWPTSESFQRQHAQLLEAVRKHGLPADPVGAVGREKILETALGRAAIRATRSPKQIAQLRPPLTELLP